MPTRSARRAPCRLAGQGSVEFILVMPVLLERDRDELVRDLVCSGTDLERDRLTVTNAKVKATTSGVVNDGDSIANELGASTLRTETRRVTVEADVAYEYNDPLSLGRKTVLTRHVSHSYTTYTDWEVL